MAHAANNAVRKNGFSHDREVKLARLRQDRQTHVGKFEREIAKYLESQGIVTIPQFAWDRYNFDLFIPTNRIAVEIRFSKDRPVIKLAVKTMELLCAGFHVVELWISETRKETASPEMLNQLISFINVARPLPSGLGQYRVIRGSGEIDTISQTYLDKFADIAIRYRSLQTSGQNTD